MERKRKEKKCKPGMSKKGETEENGDGEEEE